MYTRVAPFQSAPPRGQACSGLCLQQQPPVRVLPSRRHLPTEPSAWPQSSATLAEPCTVDSKRLTKSGALATMDVHGFSSWNDTLSLQTLSDSTTVVMPLTAKQPVPQPPPVKHQLQGVSFGVAQSPSTRPYMEDRHQVLPALPPIHAGIQMAAPLPHLPLDASYAAVFDGHSGPESAEQAAARLHVHLAADQALQAHLAGAVGLLGAREQEAVVGGALRGAFRATDEEILDTCRQDPGSRTSGSTALAALRIGNTLFTANAGDCRAVLCRDGQPLRLSEDHNLMLPSERARVQSLGGTIMKQRGLRVVVAARDGLPMRGVQVTRGLGDLHFKEPQRLVVSEPDVRRTLLEPCDAFLLLATDGVWNSVADDMALAVVQAALKEQAGAGAGATDAAHTAAKRLLWRALDRGCQDNATAVVMLLDWSQEE